MPYKDPEKARENQRAYNASRKEQQAAYTKDWAKRNPEKVKAAKRRWIEKNRELNAARRREYRRRNTELVNERKRKWERENPDRVAATRALRRIRDAKTKLAAHLRYHYNTTIDEYLSLLTVQGGGCAICGVQQNDHGRWRRLNLDHDHKTGKVRGLLCTRCNSAIGYLGDDPRRMRRAAAYVEGWSAKEASAGAAVGFQPVLAIVQETPGKSGGVEGVAEAQPVAGPCADDSQCPGVAVSAA